MNTCEVCGSKTINKRFCSATCYGKWQTGKNFNEQRKSTPARKTCSICGDTHFGRGYCRKHYRHIIRGEKPHNPKPLQNRCEYCGELFYAYHRTNRKKPRFCSSSCYGKYVQKPYIIKKGYKKVLLYNHPRADKKGYVFEHIIIAEATIGRPLKDGERCHHIDGNRLNNHPSNIQVFNSHSDHIKNGHPTLVQDNFRTSHLRP